MHCKDTQEKITMTTTSAVCPIGEITGKGKKRGRTIRGQLGSLQSGRSSCLRIVRTGSNEDAMRRRMRVVDHP